MLQRLADGVWAADDDLRLNPGFHMPVRMTVLRLPSGSLLLHSPVALDDALARELEALGEVAWIVAPSGLHHLFAAPAKARFPRARLAASAALRKKRPDLAVDAWLEGDEARPFGDGVLGVRVRGAPSVDEWVFVHEPSRSLLVTDLVFHVRRTRGWLTPWVLRVMGVHDRLGQSRAWRILVKDRAAARESAERILGLDFDRLVPAHGDPIDAGARPLLAAALTRMLPPERRALLAAAPG